MDDIEDQVQKLNGAQAVMKDMEKLLQDLAGLWHDYSGILLL